MTTTTWRQQGAVVFAEFVRPERLNSLTPAVLDDLERLLTHIESDESVRLVVVSGRGRAFSVGMDVDFLQGCFADPQGVFIPFCARYHAVLNRIEKAPALFLAAIDGLARAGGFEFLMACDLVLATTRSRIADHHIVFGIIPGGGATARAVHRLPDRVARELLLTGRWLSGAEIAQAEVANRVVEPEDLPAAIAEVAERVGKLSRPALRRMKRLVGECAATTPAGALQREFEEFCDYVQNEPTSADGFLAWVRR